MSSPQPAPKKTSLRLLLFRPEMSDAEIQRILDSLYGDTLRGTR